MEQRRFINVYLSLGSNQGDRRELVKRAEEMIDRGVGRIARRSSYYETAAWGKTDQGPYVNSVIMINTTLSPRELLEANQEIELKLGRERTGERWGPRLIDIDILFYGKRVIRDKGLDIPHPQLHNRLFVMIPLMEIADHLEHPVLKQDIISLYDECPDKSDVIMVEETERNKVKTFQNTEKAAETAAAKVAATQERYSGIVSKSGPRAPRKPQDTSAVPASKSGARSVSKSGAPIPVKSGGKPAVKSSGGKPAKKAGDKPAIKQKKVHSVRSNRGPK